MEVFGTYLSAYISSAQIRQLGHEMDAISQLLSTHLKKKMSFSFLTFALVF